MPEFSPVFVKDLIFVITPPTRNQKINSTETIFITYLTQFIYIIDHVIFYVVGLV